MIKQDFTWIECRRLDLVCALLRIVEMLDPTVSKGGA